MKKEQVDQIFEEFKNAKILVIGDVMIDCYLTGKVTRISPEAPVPIVNVQSRSYRLGGAANVALNLKSLGADPILCSVIGSDSKAKVFYNLMEDCDLTSDAIVPMYGRRTTIKYRIIGNNYQIVRVDDEKVQSLKEREKRQFLTTVEQIIDHNDIDAVIFEDYDKGLFSKDLISEIINFAHKKDTGAYSTSHHTKHRKEAFFFVAFVDTLAEEFQMKESCYTTKNTGERKWNP